MPVKPSPNTVTPEQGGRLVSARSLESVGAYNYSEKVNFRRRDDKEVRREGWVLYRPNAGLPQGVQAVPTADRISFIAECVRPNQERAIVAATDTDIFKFNYNAGTWTNVASGIHPGRWQPPVVINGYLVMNNAVDLPFTIRAEENTAYQIYELRESGIAAVGWIEELNGVLMCYDVTEVKADELNDVMNGPSPYNPVDPALCNRIAFRCIWGEIGKPRNWAPKFNVVMNAASATITLPFQNSVFIAGVTRVAVVNGGPSNGTLGGQTGYENGILVTSVVGNVITLEIPTDAGISYPRTVEVQRWEDISTISGRYDLQDDASEIITAKKLANRVIIYRRNSIFRATYVGSVAQIFEFRRVVGTDNVPIWPAAVGEVNGEYHVYPGKGDRFYMFDGVNEPSVHRVLDDARAVLMTGVNPTTAVFAIDNPLTKELWFCRPGRVLAFDYEKNTTSEIDAEIHAAAYVQRSSVSKDAWFILCINNTVFTYGLVKTASVQLLTYLRNGVSPGGRIKSGLFGWGDRYNEKMLGAHIIHLSSNTVVAPQLRLKLYGTFDEATAPELLLTEDHVGPAYLVTTFYQATFFQDEIIITDARDIDVQLTARTFNRGPINSDSIVRFNGP